MGLWLPAAVSTDQERIKNQGSRIKDQGRMVEEKQDGLDWCLGEPGQPGYRCLGPSTVIVLFYAVGCIVFGFLVSLVVMQMDKSKAKKKKRSMDQGGAQRSWRVRGGARRHRPQSRCQQALLLVGTSHPAPWRKATRSLESDVLQIHNKILSYFK